MVDISPPSVYQGLPNRLVDIVQDKNLAKLGDSYLNFLYSYTLSHITSTPTGKRVSDHLLANVARRTGLRQHLPHRSSRGEIADSVESLIVYAWLKNIMSFDTMFIYLIKASQSFEEALTNLVKNLLKKVGEGGNEASNPDSDN
ncbi:ribonuclease III family protein [[Eubacterium] cellulosolvens]